jgi:hypothetical protein
MITKNDTDYYKSILVDYITPLKKAIGTFLSDISFRDNFFSYYKKTITVLFYQKLIAEHKYNDEYIRKILDKTVLRVYEMKVPINEDSFLEEIKKMLIKYFNNELYHEKSDTKVKRVKKFLTLLSGNDMLIDGIEYTFLIKDVEIGGVHAHSCSFTLDVPFVNKKFGHINEEYEISDDTLKKDKFAIAYSNALNLILMEINNSSSDDAKVYNQAPLRERIRPLEQRERIRQQAQRVVEAQNGGYIIKKYRLIK